MHKPPLLTRREEEIVPYLVAGATRSEISNELKISEDTVKKHLKAIFSKFDVVNYRDGQFELWAYNVYYSKKGMGLNSHMNYSNLIFTLSEDRKSATMIRDQEFFVVNGPETTVKRGFSGMVRSDQIKSVFSSDRRMLQSYRFDSGVHRYSIDFDPPIKRGETFKVQEKTQIWGCLDPQGDYDRVSGEIPCSSRKMEYIFPKRDLPKEVELIVRSGGRDVNVDYISALWDQNRYIVYVERFETPLKYEVKWQY